MTTPLGEAPRGGPVRRWLVEAATGMWTPAQLLATTIHCDPAQ